MTAAYMTDPRHDTLSIEALKVDALIGIHPWEQQLKQTLIIHLDLAIDAKISAQSADLNDSIDYSEIAQHIQEFALAKPYPLLECLAEALDTFILDHTISHWLRLTIKNLKAIANAASANITIERTQAPRS